MDPTILWKASPSTGTFSNQKELVIAAMKNSDMSWVEDNISADWVVNIYRADLPEGEAEFTVPDNKGNEAMVYLTCVSVDHTGSSWMVRLEY